MTGLACAALIAAPAQGAIDLAAFDRTAQGAMAAWHQPGLAVAVVRSGAPDWLRGYGMRDLAKAEPVDPDTLFGIGSCTKPFAATTVALLVHRGRLGWDDGVAERLPWFRARDPWVTQALSVRDLLANRTGLRSEAIRTAATSRRAYLETIARSEPLHGFRANYSYTPEMFTLAGELVASVSGTPWAEFAARELWRPLGMARTNADYRVARAMPDAATPYQLIAGAMVPIEWRFEDDIALPSGGVNSSARDMAKWLGFQLGARPAGGPDLPPAALAETRLMHVPLRGPFNDSPFKEAEGVSDEGYGLGWFMLRYHGVQVYYHHGSEDGFRCFGAIVPELGLGFVGLENSPNAGLPRALFLTLLDQALDRPAHDWSGEFLARQNAIVAGIDTREARLVAARGTPQPAPLPFASYAGPYDDSGPIGEASVAGDAKGLTLTLGRETFDLKPWSGSWFELMPRRNWAAPRVAFVEFRRDPAGAVAGLALDGRLLARRP
ncbi:MAG: serine hydrolase [Novosphingobium sp.]|nr:serine hydrolase [Novosphingobium sp.]